MSEANGRFGVHCSGQVAKQLRDLQKAASSGQRKRIAIAFRAIIQRLQVDPRHTGEELYRLPTLRLQVRVVILAPLAITFAVSEDSPVVYIKNGIAI